MALEHDVALHLGTSGLRLDVWDAYSVTLSMLGHAAAWSFALWKSATRTAAWATLRREAKLGERVFFSIDGAVQLNGYIDDVQHQVDPQGGESLVVSGYDFVGAAQRADADPTLRLKGLPLDEALTRLFAPLGVAPQIAPRVDAVRRVQVGTARGPRGVARTPRRHPVDYAHPRPGERIWQVADAIVRRLGYLLYAAPHPEGGFAVVVDVPAYASSPLYRLERVVEDGLTPRTNILRSNHHVSIRDVPTDVTVYTASAQGDAVSARSSATVQNGALYNADVNAGYVVNELINQPRHIRATRARTVAGAQRQAERAIADANAGFRTVDYTVQGHGTVFGGETTLYAINSLAHVHDDRYEIDAAMLIQQLTFRGSVKTGRLTDLVLHPRGAMALSPEPDA